MAVYSLDGTNKVPFTGYTNTLGSGDANVDATSGYVQRNGLTQQDDKLAKLLQTGGQSRAIRALWRALTGAVAGGTATATKKQVQAMVGGQSGLIAIETITYINRATTAADRTALLALLDRVVYPSSYVEDLSGNGGGGKVAY